MSTFTPKFVGTAAIKKAIGSTNNRQNALKSHNQSVVLSCLFHVKQHGDWTLLASLCDTNQLLASRMIGYSETHMNATYDKKTKRFDYHEGKSAKDIDVEAAAKQKWFDFKPEQKDTSKTLEEIKASVVKLFATSIKAGKATVDQQAIVSELFDTLIANSDAGQLELIVNMDDRDAA